MGRQRQALSRRARRPVLGERRLLVRRGDRPGGARPDARAAVLHELVVRASARNRARRGARPARALAHQPGVLRLGGLRGGRVGVEARAAVPHGERRTALEGRVASHRVPRHDDGRALDQRDRSAPGTLRAARSGRRPRPEYQSLPPARGRDRGGVHRVSPRGSRELDPAGGPRDGGDGDLRAGPECRRLVHAARGLFPGRSRDLRPLRNPSLRRRGDHGIRSYRRLVREREVRHQARPDHLCEGSFVVVRRDRRGARRRQGVRRLQHRYGDFLAWDHLRWSPRRLRDRAEESRDHGARRRS